MRDELGSIAQERNESRVQFPSIGIVSISRLIATFLDVDDRLVLHPHTALQSRPGAIEFFVELQKLALVLAHSSAYFLEGRIRADDICASSLVSAYQSFLLSCVFFQLLKHARVSILLCFDHWVLRSTHWASHIVLRSAQRTVDVYRVFAHGHTQKRTIIQSI